MGTTRIDTKKAERRTLKFASIGDLRSDLAAIEAAHSAGTLRFTGNWTPGEIIDHLANLWEFSLDGFPAEINPPFFVKLFCYPMRFLFTNGKTLSPGYQLPKQAARIMPRPNCPFDQALARMRRLIDRVDAGERLTKPSPVFGKLSHDQWLRLHFGHCQLHLGFLHPR